MTRRFVVTAVLLHILAVSALSQVKYSVVSTNIVGRMYFASVEIAPTDFDRSILLTISRSLPTQGRRFAITFQTTRILRPTLFAGKWNSGTLSYSEWVEKFRSLDEFEGPYAEVLSTETGLGVRIWSRDSGLVEWAERSRSPFHNDTPKFDLLWITPIQRMAQGWPIRNMAAAYVRVHEPLTENTAETVRSILNQQLGTDDYLYVDIREDGWFMYSQDYPTRNPFDWQSGPPTWNVIRRSAECSCYWLQGPCKYE